MKLGDLFSTGVPSGAADVDIAGLTADSRHVRTRLSVRSSAGRVAAHGRDFIAQAKAKRRRGGA